MNKSQGIGGRRRPNLAALVLSLLLLLVLAMLFTGCGAGRIQPAHLTLDAKWIHDAVEAKRCFPAGQVHDDTGDDLAEKIARVGGNVGLVVSIDDANYFYAEAFHCGNRDIGKPSSPAYVPGPSYPPPVRLYSPSSPRR